MKFHQPNLSKWLAGGAIAALLTATGANAFDEEKPKAPEKTMTAKQEADKDDKAEDKKSDTSDKKDKKKKKDKTVEEAVKDMTAIDGLFKLYQDPKKGSLSMEINADQLNKDYIYTSHVADGVVPGGHFRGQYRQNTVVTLRKYFDRIELVELNTNFYFDPDNAVAKSADANISESVIWAGKIKAETKKDGEADRYLVAADSLFMSTAFDPVKPFSRPGQKPGERFTLGKLSKGKSKIANINNYPKNTAINVDYVYDNPNPLNFGGPEITDPRYVTVSIQHSLLEMPENDYKPRYDDARVGYFLDYVTDLTDRTATPYRDMINRWHLVKKDPAAKVSDPVEPIVWWIENTTPQDLRPTIKAAALEWNKAFEKAGFSNAMVVKEQPDDADWDAGDIRYNVLRWTSSPTPPFGGYGPSFSNPRTGQIIGADIMLEYSFLTNRLNNAQIFESAVLGTDKTALDDALEGLHGHDKYCGLAGLMQQNNMVGHTMLNAFNGQAGDHEQLRKEAVYYLVLHELGHTLGLNHNMRATQARPYATAHDISAQENGLTGSVMDYPAINFAKKGAEQAHYYQVTPGTYDDWAIQFGYDPDLDDPEKRTALLNRSTEKGLQFGNDADDMRAAGKGIDPRVNIYDFSDDAVKYAVDRLELDREAASKLKDKIVNDGDTYQELRNAFLILTGDMAWQGRVISRYIGGVKVERTVAGQQGADVAPYEPISADKQREAMKALKEYIFAPEAFEVGEELVKHLAIQRRGYAHFSATEDPKLLGRAGTIQADILAHVLHPSTLSRISNSGLYGNDYSITEMMGDLTDAIFEADSRSSVNSYRQGLQIHYTHRLIGILTGGYDYIAKSNALANLRDIRKNMSRWRGDAETRAHREHIAFIIDKALEVEGK